MAKKQKSPEEEEKKKNLQQSQTQPAAGKNPNLQMHYNVAMNAMNEIAQWTGDIIHKPGKELLVPDLIS